MEKEKQTNVVRRKTKKGAKKVDVNKIKPYIKSGEKVKIFYNKEVANDFRGFLESAFEDFSDDERKVRVEHFENASDISEKLDDVEQLKKIVLNNENNNNEQTTMGQVKLPKPIDYKIKLEDWVKLEEDKLDILFKNNKGATLFFHVNRGYEFSSEEFAKLEKFEKRLRSYGCKILFKELDFYSFYAVKNSNRVIDDWAEEINNARGQDGQPLSPLEKYMYAYHIVTAYAYKLEEEGKNSGLSRDVTSVVFNKFEKICCVGYSVVLKSLCHKIGIPCLCQLVHSKQIDENIVDHEMLRVYIDDEKYNIKGIYMSDPCWDSISERDGIVTRTLANFLIKKDTRFFNSQYSYVDESFKYSFVDRLSFLKSCGILKSTEDFSYHDETFGSDCVKSLIESLCEESHPVYASDLEKAFTTVHLARGVSEEEIKNQWEIIKQKSAEIAEYEGVSFESTNPWNEPEKASRFDDKKFQRGLFNDVANKAYGMGILSYIDKFETLFVKDVGGFNSFDLFELKSQTLEPKDSMLDELIKMRKDGKLGHFEFIEIHNALIQTLIKHNVIAQLTNKYEFENYGLATYAEQEIACKFIEDFLINKEIYNKLIDVVNKFNGENSVVELASETLLQNFDEIVSKSNDFEQLVKLKCNCFAIRGLLSTLFKAADDIERRRKIDNEITKICTKIETIKIATMKLGKSVHKARERDIKKAQKEKVLENEKKEKPKAWFNSNRKNQNIKERKTPLLKRVLNRRKKKSSQEQSEEVNVV